MTAKPVPEHISDERLAKLVARMRTQAIETAEDHLPHAAREYAEVECALTELQHRREAEAGTPVAFRWLDGEGHNAGWRYSDVDPRQDDREVEMSGAHSVGVCEPLYLAASPSSPASGARVKPLRWVPYNDGVRAKSILRGIYAVLHDGDDPDEWSARYDGRVLGYHRSQSDGEAACQSHFDAAIRSALGEQP